MELGKVDASYSPAQPRRATLDIPGGSNSGGAFVPHMVAKEFIPGAEFAKTLVLAAAGANVVAAAPAAGKQNKISSLQISNSSAAAVQFTISDNATIIFQCQVPAGSGVQGCFFNPPLIGTAATVTNCAISGAAVNVLVNIQGYVE